MPKKMILLTFFISILASLALCSFRPLEIKTKEEIRLGVWITVFSPEKVLSSKENVDRLISTCKTCGIDDVYIQLYRSGKSYYNPETSEADTLRYLIETAKENNIKVHAWINLLSIAQNKDADILKKFGDAVLTLDQHGRTSMQKGQKDELDKYYIRENQLFLEPGDSRVQDYLTGVATEIIKKYPGLSGLHLDYIRYPAVVPFVPGSRFTSHGISYGYTELNINNFKNATGIDIKDAEYSRENYKLWDDWRRGQVTSLLQKISESARALSPDIIISCTIVPSVERTYLTTLQDWTEWLDKDYVDYVVAMNYTDDTKLMKLFSYSLSAEEFGEKVHMGVGAYLLKTNPKELKEQLEFLKEFSPPGIVVFSYDDIAENEDLRKTLAGI